MHTIDRACWLLGAAPVAVAATSVTPPGWRIETSAAGTLFLDAPVNCHFEWYDAKSIHIQARFDKVAVHQNRLMFISLVAFSQDVKAIRAGLAWGIEWGN